MLHALLTLPIALYAAGLPTPEDNDALLGIVATPAKGGVRLAFVVPDSPAARAGMKAGDLLLELGGRELEGPAHVDRLLAGAKPGEELAYELRRGRDRVHRGEATLAARAELESEYLTARKRGQTGFRAPDWFGFAWAGLEEDAEPPSRAASAGKVVVIHAFQSW